MLRDQFVNFVKRHIPFNNKGILIPLYFLVSCMGVAFLFDAFKIDPDTYLSENGSVYFIMGIGTFVTGIWIYFSCNDYYKDKEGNKVKVDIDNRFFFIKMKYWAYISFAGAAAFLLSAFLSKN